MKMLSLIVGAALTLVSSSASANAYAFGFDQGSFVQVAESRALDLSSNGTVGFEMLLKQYEDRFDPWTDLWPDVQAPKDEHRSIPWIDLWRDFYRPKDDICPQVLVDRCCIDCARVLHTKVP